MKKYNLSHGGKWRAYDNAHVSGDVEVRETAGYTKKRWYVKMRGYVERFRYSKEEIMNILRLIAVAVIVIFGLMVYTSISKTMSKIEQRAKQIESFYN